MSRLDLLEERSNIQERLILEMLSDLKIFSNLRQENLAYANQKAKKLIRKLEVYKATGKEIENAELI